MVPVDIPYDLLDIRIGIIDFMNYMSSCISNIEEKQCFTIYNTCNCCQEFTRDDGDWVHHHIGQMGFQFDGAVVFLKTLEFSTESGQGYGEFRKGIIVEKNPYNQPYTTSICNNITFGQLYDFFQPLYDQFPYLSDFLILVISEIQAKKNKETIKRSILFPEEISEIIKDIIAAIKKGEYSAYQVQ